MIWKHIQNNWFCVLLEAIKILLELQILFWCDKHDSININARLEQAQHTTHMLLSHKTIIIQTSLTLSDLELWL